ncbi:protein KASH5 isoform X2 [Poecile atricapillus]|uniref:protein KASH5 isoform X2 n=1 Tax=Poecile atricapillus TaxID=48891 RepID=UPI002739F8B8|nr:protein KASH5 isoform X2 [Poecile atricapillus]
MAAEGPCAPGAVIPLPAPAESSCSDEFALDCTFAACDPERTGMVQPQRVVEYVAAMTGHSGHDGRLRALQQALDPAAAGTALDWTRFRTAMGAWIAACRQDGAEEQDVATGDAGPAPVGGCWHRKGESGWPQWGRKHSPLCPVPQRTTDMCPQQPPSSRVTTWMSPPLPRPRGCGAVPGNWQPRMPNCSGMLSWPRSSTPAWLRRLHSSRHSCEGASKGSRAWGLDQHPGNAEMPFGSSSSRQALEQARVAIEELDDMKATVKQLEEENTELRRQARHAEKQQYSLGSQAEALQEENQQLLAEGQGLREQIQAQAARMASLEVSGGTVAMVGGAGGCVSDEEFLSPSLCPGPALPWHCPAVCPGHSPCPGPVPQAGQRMQELTAALEEYERVVQELRLETARLRQQLGRMRDAWAMRPWCPRSQLDIQATVAVSQVTGDKEEEDTGMVLSRGGGLAGSSEEVAEVVAPQALLSPWTPLSPWALALLALLALFYLLPHQWPQPQLRYRGPPPL